MQRMVGKLKSLTIEEKLRLIDFVESGNSIKDAAKKHDINRNTAHYIVKNKDKIRNGVSSKPGMIGFKRLKCTRSPELEKRVLEEINDARDRGEKLSGSAIKAVASELALRLNVNGFGGSNGWLYSFCKRNNISITQYNKDIESSKTLEIVYQPLSEQEEEEFHLNDNYITDESVESTVTANNPTASELTSNAHTHEIIEIEETEDNFSQPQQEVYIANDSTEMKEDHAEMTVGTGNSEAESESEPSWNYWCRVCGDINTLQEIDYDLTPTALQVFHIPPEKLRYCAKCREALANITQLQYKAYIVESLITEITQRENTEKLPDESITELRREFGIDSDLPDQLTIKEINDSCIENIIFDRQNKEETESMVLEGYQDEEFIYGESEDSQTNQLLYMQETNDTANVLEEFLDSDSVDTTSEAVYISDVVASAPKAPDEFQYTFKCHVCYETFEQFCILSNHARNAHGCMPQVECTCGRYLATWDSLMVHRRKHSKLEATFCCSQCGMKFRTQPGLSIHIKFKHDRPAKCHECQICLHQFKERSVLKAHMKTHLPDAEKYLFECEYCNKCLVNKSSLQHHISTIHQSAKNHFCHLCGRAFGHKSNLRSHLISHQTENVSCDVCSKVFKNRISLQSHRKIHKPSQEMGYQCHFCDKRFYSQNNLARHFVSHSNEKPFKCTFANCNNAYKWAKDLRNHQASHSGERRFACLWCDKRFSDSSNCRKHKVREHPEELVSYEAEHGKRQIHPKAEFILGD